MARKTSQVNPMGEYDSYTVNGDSDEEAKSNAQDSRKHSVAFSADQTNETNDSPKLEAVKHHFSILACFAEHSDIHGLADILRSKFWGKAFWLAFLCLALGLLGLQLSYVFDTFISQVTGSGFTSYSPDRMPSVFVCPNNWIDPAYVEESILFPHTRRVMNGYFPVLGMNAVLDELENGQPPENRSEHYRQELTHMNDFVMNYQRGSLTSAFEYVSVEGTIWGLSYSIPTLQPLGEVYTINWNGVCYEEYSNVSSNLMQKSMAGYKFDVVAWQDENQTRDMTFDGKDPVSDVYEADLRFRLAVGDRASMAVSFDNEKFLEYRRNYIVRVIPTKSVKVSTRKRPCRSDWTQADSMYCKFKYGNFKCRDEGACETFLPSTKHYPEWIAPRYCNYFAQDLAETCLIKTLNLPITNDEWAEMCPPPCIHEKYDFTYQVVPQLPEAEEEYEIPFSLIELKFGNGGEGRLMKEYLILDISSFWSQVGGTAGLYIGASGVSLVQIIYWLCLRRPIEGKRTD